MSIDIRLPFVTALLVIGAASFAQQPADSLYEELADEDIRENPVFESGEPTAVDMASADDYGRYHYLDSLANCISLNGADWSLLQRKFALSGERPLNIVHIGDSHIQAGMSAATVRRLLQDDFGSEGRGLIVPLRLAGTNGPSDYAVRSNVGVCAERLLRFSDDSRMGFTGISVTPDANKFTITVSSREFFERIRVFYGGDALNVDGVEYGGSGLVCAVSEGQSYIEISLPFPCEELSMRLSTLGSVSIYGMELCGDIIGVAYHAIGINGATYGSYNRVGDFGMQLSVLSPDLIIVSLGTNEAFGRFSAVEFGRQLDRFVSDLMNANPSSAILLVTPAECQRRVRRGRRRRASYSVNANIANVAEAIRSYGRSNSIPVYDWYAAAGGEGTSAKWLADGLLGRDRVHCTAAGYELTGRMLYYALVSALQLNNFITDDPQ